MSNYLPRRSMWLLPFAAAAVLALAAAAYGATTHSAAAPTLVIDNSFTIKTSDPQRAFDPTASIIDRALYDTLFTYKGATSRIRFRCSSRRGRRPATRRRSRSS